jgi:hypothetical protein
LNTRDWRVAVGATVLSLAIQGSTAGLLHTLVEEMGVELQSRDSPAQDPWRSSAETYDLSDASSLVATGAERTMPERGRRYAIGSRAEEAGDGKEDDAGDGHQGPA